MTTNIQSVTISDNTEDCSLTVTCQFASGSTANECHVIFRNNVTTNNTEILTKLSIVRIGQSLVSTANITGTQYELFKREFIYTAEAFGTVNGTRTDELITVRKFQLTNSSNMCQTNCKYSIMCICLILNYVLIII